MNKSKEVFGNNTEIKTEKPLFYTRRGLELLISGMSDHPTDMPYAYYDSQKRMVVVEGGNPQVQPTFRFSEFPSHAKVEEFLMANNPVRVCVDRDTNTLERI